MAAALTPFIFFVYIKGFHVYEARKRCSAHKKEQQTPIQKIWRDKTNFKRIKTIVLLFVYVVSRPALCSAAVLYKTSFFFYHTHNPEITGNQKSFFSLLFDVFPLSAFTSTSQIQGSQIGIKKYKKDNLALVLA